MFFEEKNMKSRFISDFYLYFCNQIKEVMSIRLSIQDALKRVHLNTVTLKNEENARFVKALHDHIRPRNQITNFKENVVESHVRDFLVEAFYKGEHYIGKKDENNTDLCIFAEDSEDSAAQVLIECKNINKIRDKLRFHIIFAKKSQNNWNVQKYSLS